MSKPSSFVHNGHKVTLLRNPGAREWIVEIEYPPGSEPTILTRPSRLSEKDVKTGIKRYIETGK